MSDLQFSVVDISDEAIYLVARTFNNCLMSDMSFHCRDRPEMLRVQTAELRRLPLPAEIQKLILEYSEPVGSWRIVYNRYYGPGPSNRFEMSGIDDTSHPVMSMYVHMAWNWFYSWQPFLIRTLSKQQRQMCNIL